MSFFVKRPALSNMAEVGMFRTAPPLESKTTTPLGPKRTVPALGRADSTADIISSSGAAVRGAKTKDGTKISKKAVGFAEGPSVRLFGAIKLDTGSASLPSEDPVLAARPRTPPREADSDSEDDWVPTSRRKTPQSARKRIVQSSDEDSPVRPSVVDASQPRAVRPLIDLTEDTDSESGLDAKTSASGDSDADSLLDTGRAGRPIIVGSSDEESGSGRSAQAEHDEDDQGADECAEDDDLSWRIKKHYDTSAGSLDDFIVHDSDEFTDPELVERPAAREWSEAEEDYTFHDGSEQEISSSSDSGSVRRRDESRAKRDTVELPDLGALTLSASPPGSPKSRSKRSRGQLKKADMTVKKWEAARQRIAETCFEELDKQVFNGRLGPEGCSTIIKWNKTLNKTGGKARRERNRSADSTDASRKHTFTIELSEKVLTEEHRVRSTLAHEMCHVATWYIDEDDAPHGKNFFKWGKEVTQAMRDIKVTTCHSYAIEYKYRYRCSNEKCNEGDPKEWGRHSKSIDVDKKRCGSCHSKIVALFDNAARAETPWRAFLRINMPLAKGVLGKVSHAQVMQALAARWAIVRPETDDSAHWNGLKAGRT